MIIGAAAGVLLPEFSRMSGEGADGGQFVRLWQAAVLKSSAIIYPLSVFCCVFAPEIICLCMGRGIGKRPVCSGSSPSFNLARIMPYAPVLFALGRGKAFARAHLVTALLIVGLDLLCVMAFPSLWAIAAIATGCTLFCLFLLMMTTARVLGTSLAGLMPWRMLTTVLLVSAAACTAARLAVLLTGMTHRLAVVSVGSAVYRRCICRLHSGPESAIWSCSDRCSRNCGRTGRKGFAASRFRPPERSAGLRLLGPEGARCRAVPAGASVLFQGFLPCPDIRAAGPT